jgi:hypothetical protein
MRSNRWRAKSFLGCLAVMAIIWGWVLPRLTDLDAVRSRIDSNRKAGINPTAVFYTDHPTMREIENRIENRIDAGRVYHRRKPSSAGTPLGDD